MSGCILCHAHEVDPVLDLGPTALANKFLLPDEVTDQEPIFPLEIGVCRSCGHVQLTSIVPPEAMFDDYLYISSMSTTLVEHLHGLSDAVVAWSGAGPGDMVVDVGCNDGTLLGGFARHGLRIVGVDPARNLAPLATQRGATVVTAYFGAETARDVLARFGPARVITATNAFPHIPRLDDFMTGIRTLLAPDGVFVIEAHYLLDMLDQLAFDTIYHEHVSYWSLNAARTLFARHGLEVVHVERLPIHHGQLRMFVQRAGRGADASVATRLAEEAERGLPGREPLDRFAEATARVRSDLRAFVRQAQAEGRRLAAYGAPAKGNTLITYLGLGPDAIAWIADRSPLKQGRVTPGTHIPVVPPDRILETMPDYLVLLAWNFADEILAQQAEYRARGGRFVIPVPAVRVI